MKVLIVTNHMNIGGIQKSLLELIKRLSKCPEYEVSLFCCKKTGALLERLPKNIRILPENPYAIATEQPLQECCMQGIKIFCFRLLMSLWSKIFTKAVPASILCHLIGKIESTYDVAISYSQPIEDRSFCNLTNEIVLSCVQAKQKITFVHCDFGSYGGNTKRNRKLYEKFDRIAVVSKSVGKRLVEIIPEVVEKLETVYNFCDSHEIELLANQDPIVYNKKTIVTVARLSVEKGISRCIPIFRRLYEKGLDFEWHIVGGGPLRTKIENEIKNNGLEKHIVLEGEQLNPYRFMKNADYLLLPSYHEAAPIVFDEAMALGIPVLTTNTLSADELVGKRGGGVVCENTEQAIYEMLYEAISNQKMNNIPNQPNNAVCMEQFNNLCKLR